MAEPMTTEDHDNSDAKAMQIIRAVLENARWSKSFKDCTVWEFNFETGESDWR